MIILEMNVHSGGTVLKKYIYAAPKIKSSSKLVDVRNDREEIVAKFKRVYRNPLIKFLDSFFLDGDFFVQFDTYSPNGKIKYRGGKKVKKIKTEFYIEDCEKNNIYNVTYKSLQTIAPELLIKSDTEEYVVKKIPTEWARFYDQGKEVARWRMKTTELFKTYLEIEEDSPIQDPAFFICLFQCIFYVG
jgi:hypothetical protein